MARIRISESIQATPSEVWAHLTDIATHVEWMADAHAITFEGVQREGVGAAFLCDTRVGPIRMVDHMEITEWEEQRIMGVAHSGLVTGSGRFVLEPVDSAPPTTTLTWEETLTARWWLGGRIAMVPAAPILRRIWVGNLRRLRERVEARGAGAR